MSTDHTEHQSQEELERAKELSLRGTLPPVDLASYEAQRLIGKGAFGEVWTAVDRNTGRQVAIKFYTQRSRLDWTLLSREVEKLVFLSADRYVVQLLDVGWDSDPPYYVMEYIEGGSLHDLLAAHGPLPANDAAEMFREIATGLVHAHGKGVLHCDLKPANVLLDQDLRPRLADFGQSRLSHEQSPALGTLFYMAPEQADIQSVPDARWDVYALGAILFCMLTGNAPHRNDEVLEKLDQAEGLVEKLADYRRYISTAAVPTLHRRLPGVDRALADIVERCLALDPHRRFANVQAVLDALNRRDEARVRNPLLFLGFVGPVLLLCIMALFGLRGYKQAISKSELSSIESVYLRNHVAAELAASAIETEIWRLFHVIDIEAEKSALLHHVQQVAESGPVNRLNALNRKGDPIDSLRKEMLNDPARLELDRYLDSRLAWYLDKVDRDGGLMMSSLFVVDAQGRMLATAYDHSNVSRSDGWCFAHRTYFHGLAADLTYDNNEEPKKQMPSPGRIQAIRAPHFSSPFQSTTSKVWKVAISAPVFAEGDPDGEVIGVLALTINLADFQFVRSSQQIVALIDGRQGMILQHPFFETNRDSNEFHVSAAQLAELRAQNTFYRYHDPIAEAPGGAEFEGDWLAAIERVALPGADTHHDARTAGAEVHRTGSSGPDSNTADSDGPAPDAAESDGEEMLVLVQERFDDAIRPVHELGGTLILEGLWALGGVIAVIVMLWYIVLKMLNEPKMILQRRPGTASLPTANHQLTTARSEK